MKRKQALVLSLASTIAFSSAVCVNAQSESLTLVVKKDNKALLESVVIEILDSETNTVIYEGKSVKSMLMASVNLTPNKKYTLRYQKKI